MGCISLELYNGVDSRHQRHGDHLIRHFHRRIGSVIAAVAMFYGDVDGLLGICVNTIVTAVSVTATRAIRNLGDFFAPTFGIMFLAVTISQALIAVASVAILSIPVPWLFRPSSAKLMIDQCVMEFTGGDNTGREIC